MQKSIIKKGIKLVAVVVFAGIIQVGFQAQSITAPSEQEIQGLAVIKEDIQTVTTEMHPFKYKTIYVQKGLPVRWVISAKANTLNGCNNPIVIPEFKIKRKLAVGENTIEFTPKEEGDFLYTCWMGMLRGNIKVVSDLSKFSLKQVQKDNTVGQFFKKD